MALSSLPLGCLSWAHEALAEEALLSQTRAVSGSCLPGASHLSRPISDHFNNFFSVGDLLNVSCNL